MLWGSITSGLGMLLISSLTIWHFYTCFSFLAGWPVHLVMPLPCSPYYPDGSLENGYRHRHCDGRRRYRSIAIQPLVGILAQNYGWQATYIFAGSLVLVVNVPLILFVLKDRPESMGLLPDGDEPGQTAVPVSVKAPVQIAVKIQNPGPNNERFAYLKTLHYGSWGLVLLLQQSVPRGYHSRSFIPHRHAYFRYGGGDSPGHYTRHRCGCRFVFRLASRQVDFPLRHDSFLLVIDDRDADTDTAVSMSQIWPFVIIYGLGIGAGGTLLPIVTRIFSGARDFSAMFGFVIVLLSAGNSIGAPWPDICMTPPGLTTRVYHHYAVYIAAIVFIYFAFGVNPKPLVRPPKIPK